MTRDRSRFAPLRRPSIARWAALVAVIAACSMGLPDGPDPALAASSSSWVMGYHVGYQRGDLPTAEVPWGSMTHIIIGAVTPRPDGSLDTTFFIDPTAGPAWAKDVAAQAKANGVHPLLMVGGAGSIDGWRGASATAARRTTFVNNLVALVRDYGVEGLDLDWEPIQADDDDEVVALVNALRAAAPSALLTMPVGVPNDNFTSADVRPVFGTLAAKLDRLSIMSYGMAGPYDGWNSWLFSPLHGATSSTPMAVDDSVAAYRAVGVPAEKLNLGLGFYGMCYQGNVTGPRQPLNGSTMVNDDNALPYRRIVQDHLGGGTYHYDTAAEAPWVGFPSPFGPQGCRMLSYEDATSIAAKGAWAKAQGLGGAIVWTIAEGHLPSAAGGQRDPLLTAARTAFASETPTTTMTTPPTTARRPQTSKCG
jgi:chitinase